MLYKSEKGFNVFNVNGELNTLVREKISDLTVAHIAITTTEKKPHMQME